MSKLLTACAQIAIGTLAVSLLVISPAYGNKSCLDLFQDFAGSAAKGPQFTSVLGLRTHIENQGLLWRDLRLVIESGEGATATLYYKGQPIGGGHLQYLENQNHDGRIYIDLIVIDKPRMGLGVLVYMALAKQAYLQGRILESSHNLETTDVENLWRGLVRHGYAVQVDQQFFEYRLNVLQSVEFQQQVDVLLQSLSLRPHEFVDGLKISKK